MKYLFRGYYTPTNEEFKELWAKCTFILDTNVLLNLYRYKKEASDQLMEVFRTISNSDRLWIPHQVAFEFQKNRHQVIGEQINRYTEIRNIINDSKTKLEERIGQLGLQKRHSLINPENFLKEIDDAIKKFDVMLVGLEAKQQKITGEDKLRDELDILFGKKIGEPFKNEELEKIYKEGEERYKLKRPPGYSDIQKDDVYLFNELVIQRKYGDLIIWKQIIKEAVDQKLTHIILVTDDNKKDWWVEQSNKTIGPRPELIEEITQHSSIVSFHMYNSASFLNFANDFLKTKVDKEIIQEVNEVSQITLKNISGPFKISPYREYSFDEIEFAIFNWLKNEFPQNEVTKNFTNFPDFCLNINGKITGYEVVVVRNLDSMINRMRDKVMHGDRQISNKLINSLEIIVINDTNLDDSEIIVPLQYMTLKMDSYTMERINISLGHLISLDDSLVFTGVLYL